MAEKSRWLGKRKERVSGQLFDLSGGLLEFWFRHHTASDHTVVGSEHLVDLRGDLANLFLWGSQIELSE
jgi:hypothetical protein